MAKTQQVRSGHWRSIPVVRPPRRAIRSGNTTILDSGLTSFLSPDCDHSVASPPYRPDVLPNMSRWSSLTAMGTSLALPHVGSRHGRKRARHSRRAQVKGGEMSHASYGDHKLAWSREGLCAGIDTLFGIARASFESAGLFLVFPQP